MKRNLYILQAFFAVLAFSACSSESTPEVDYQDPTGYFIANDSDTSAIANIRRNFDKETGIHLLVNDTLQHYKLGTDINGQDRYFTETIDLGYDIGQSATASTTYTFTYLNTADEVQKATDFLKGYILNHVQGKLKPYSIFICKTLYGYDRNMNKSTTAYAVSNKRCVAVSSNYIISSNRTDALKKSYASRILNVMMQRQASNYSSAFKPFYAYGTDYYGRSISGMGYATNVESLRQAGFITSMSTDQTFPKQDEDQTSYILAVLQNDDTQLENLYGKYNLIMTKINVIKQILEQLGYVF